MEKHIMSLIEVVFSTLKATRDAKGDRRILSEIKRSDKALAVATHNSSGIFRLMEVFVLFLVCLLLLVYLDFPLLE